jgi:hypothetical protein
MTEICRYKAGGADMIVTIKEGKLFRNGCPIKHSKTGRKYVEISYSQRHQYLCKLSDCYKNTFKNGCCKDHLEKV